MPVLKVLSTNAIAGSGTEYQVVQTGYYRVLATAAASTVSFNGGPAITLVQNEALLLKSGAQLHNLVMKGQEAVDGILDVARSSDHPRAYEVAGQLIKNVGDVADKLIDLQKKMKELDDESTKVTNNTTNALFVGSTAELQKMLKQQKDLNKKDTK